MMQQMTQMGWPMMLLLMFLCGVLLVALIAFIVLAINRLTRAR